MFPTRHLWLAEARALGRISTSVTVTMFAQLAMSAVETLIVARLGIRELAGVTLALSIHLLVFLFALGVVTALTPIAAAAMGRGDAIGARLSGQQGLWAGLTFSLPGVVLLLVCRSLLETVLGAGVETESASAYLAGAALGLPAWVTYVAVRSLAVATGQVRLTTIVMLASIPLHAALTWWLVFGGLFLPPLGALGAGLAYATAGYGALGLLALAVRILPSGILGSTLRRPFGFDRARYLEILRLGIPFACRILLREGVLPASAFLIAPFGASAVAAHAVALRVVDLCGVFSFGFSDAANARVSHATGAGKSCDAVLSGWVAVGLATFVGLLMAGVLLAAPLTVVRAILGDADSADLQAAATLLPFAAALLFLEGVQSAVGGALSGLRDARGPLIIAIQGAWLLGMPLGFVLAWLSASPASGLWSGLIVGACTTTVLYLRRFRKRVMRG